MRDILAPLSCLVYGHDDHYRHGDHRMYLECQRCGRESVGWRDDELPKPTPMPRVVKTKLRVMARRKSA